MKEEASLYIRPQSAMKKMKAAARNQTIYIYGASGSGKTSFIRSYFANKRYQYVSLADVRTDDAGRLRKIDAPVIVLDDLQLAADTRFREELYPVIEELIENPDVQLVLIARCKIPEWLMTLDIRYVFCTIEEQELFFNNREIAEYVSKWNISVPKSLFDQIVLQSRGYPMWIRIAALEYQRLNADGAGQNLTDDEFIERTRNQYWIYLEHYVYNQWSQELQEFLMELSIVEQFDIELAQMLTRRNDVARMLQQARETGNFLIHRDNNTWELRRTMKFSFRMRLNKRYTTTQINDLYNYAGHYYEMKNDYLNALRMYETGHSNEHISALLISNARQNPASGHYYELRKYYLELPKEEIAKSIVLMTGMSMLQSLLMNEEESEYWYGQLEIAAKKLKGSEKREADSKLLYLDIALPHRGTIQMVSLLKHANVLIGARTAILPELSVTSNLPSMMNGGKDFSEWSKKDRELARTIGKPVEFILGKYGKGLVNLALAESFFEKGGDASEIAALVQKGRMQAEAGGKVEQCFVAVGILTNLHILHNHMENAAELLQSFYRRASTEAPQLLNNIEALQCRCDMYCNKQEEVSRWYQEAPDENHDFSGMERLRYLTKVRIYIQMHRYSKAMGLLDQLSFYAEKMQRTYILIEIQLLHAILNFQKKNQGWSTAFAEAYEKAKEYHFVWVIAREGIAVLPLLKAYSVGKPDEYDVAVMEMTERMAQNYPLYMSRISTLEEPLTKMEQQILQMHCDGIATPKITELLSVSPNTVKFHNSNIYRKLGVKSKSEAVTAARQLGLVH